MSKLDYECSECGLEIQGTLAPVLEAIRLHEHDWAAFVQEVEMSLRYSAR